MPYYTFALRDDDAGIQDDSGISLPNDEIAYRYACDVARELMRHREQASRDWQLDVYENDEKVFEILFASLDETLTPAPRKLLEEICRQRRSLKDSVQDAKLTHREATALVARSRGKPYLAAECGQKTIRDDAGVRSSRPWQPDGPKLVRAPRGGEPRT